MLPHDEIYGWSYIKEIVFVEKLSHKLHSSPYDFVDEFFKKEIILISPKIFQKIERKDHFAICFIDVSVTLVSKLTK